MAEVEFSKQWQKKQEKLAEQEKEERQKIRQKAVEYEKNFHQLLESYGQLLFNTSDLFTTAVIGELKSGKSTFINALLGGNILYSKSSSATAFPLRIVHDVAQKDNISIKYIYNQDTINELISTLNKYDIDPNISNTIRNFFSITITEKKNNLNGKNVYSELETLNSILRDLNDVDNYPVEKLLTSLVPEISLNFKSFSLNGFVDLPSNRTFSNIPHKAVFIDTPGIGESGALNNLFKWLISDICHKVDYNILVLEKGGRNTANEFEMVQILKNSKSFSVVASKLDDYNEDIKYLLEEDIPDRFTKFENLHKVYGVSQHKFLVANIVLNDFKKHGAIVDTGESYIEDILKDVYGRKEIKQYRNKDEGYEQYLKKNDDYIDVLNDIYLHGEGQEFLHMLEDLYLKIYYSWKQEVLTELQSLSLKIDPRVNKYLNSTAPQTLSKINFKKKELKEQKQLISNCLEQCFVFESYDYIITENNGKTIDNLDSIRKIIKYNKPFLVLNKKAVFECDYYGILWGSLLILVPWIGWDMYHYGLNVSTALSFLKEHSFNSALLVGFIFFILAGFRADISRQKPLEKDINQASKFARHFRSYGKLSESDNVQRMNFVMDKLLSFK